MPVPELNVGPRRHPYWVGGITIAATVVLYNIFLQKRGSREEGR